MKILISYIVPLVFTIVYAIFPHKFHFADGLVYAYYIKKFPITHVFHQHHLLWLPLVHLIYHKIPFVSSSVTPLQFLSFFNALMGGLLIFTFSKITARFTSDGILRLIVVLFLGGSWGVMLYGTDANVYMTVLVLHALIFYILITYKLTWKICVLITLLTSLASLLHQISFFFSIVVLIYLLISLSKDGFKGKILTSVLLYSTVVLSSYVIIYIVTIGITGTDLQLTFPQWLTAYGNQSMWWTPFHVGTVHSLAYFSYSQLLLFWKAPGSDLVFHAKPFSGTEYLPLSLLINIIIVILVIHELLSLVKGVNKEIPYRKVRLTILVWFILYYLFNNLYCSFEIHYKLFYLLPLILIILIKLSLINTIYKNIYRDL